MHFKLFRLLLLSAFLISLYFPASAQRGRHWYFGRGAAVRFDVGGPVPLNNSAMPIGDAVANMSDPSGRLLFYSNGNTVWGSDHLPMPHGTNLISGTLPSDWWT